VKRLLQSGRRYPNKTSRDLLPQKSLKESMILEQLQLNIKTHKLHWREAGGTKPRGRNSVDRHHSVHTSLGISSRYKQTNNRYSSKEPTLSTKRNCRLFLVPIHHRLAIHYPIDITVADEAMMRCIWLSSQIERAPSP
jgi:hypothetical protein